MKPHKRLMQSLKGCEQRPVVRRRAPAFNFCTSPVLSVAITAAASVGVFGGHLLGGKTPLEIAEAIPLPVRLTKADFRRIERARRRKRGWDYRITFLDWIKTQPGSTRRGVYRGRFEIPPYVKN